MSNNIAEIITDRIIQSLEKGKIPWKKTWINAPKNAVSKKDYRGINRLLLSMTEFSTPYFLTFKQAQNLGGHIKKGSRGIPVLFWQLVKIEEDGELTGDTVPFMRYYTVFNLDQVEGIDKSKFSLSQNEFESIEDCEDIVKEYKDSPEVLHRGCQPCYSPSKDTVEIPAPEYFTSEEEYYSTLFHELTHSTGHKSRLNRKEISSINKFGSDSYAEEELVAEFGASFLCGYAGIENAVIENTTAYIQGWLNVLRNDRKMIINAASRAEKAMNHILGN